MAEERLPWEMSQTEQTTGQAANTKREEVTIKFGKGLVGTPFQSKSGKELVEIRIPNQNPEDKRPWESFVVSPKMVHDNQYGKGVWLKLPADGATKVSRSVRDGTDETGKTVWRQEIRTVSNIELKSMMEAYRQKDKESVLNDLAAKRGTVTYTSARKYATTKTEIR